VEKYNKLTKRHQPLLIKIIKERPEEYPYSKYKIGWLLILRHDFGDYITATSLKVNGVQNWDNGVDITIAVKKGDYVVCDNRLYLDKKTNKFIGT
jgi:hypothetical protein